MCVSVYICACARAGVCVCVSVGVGVRVCVCVCVCVCECARVSASGLFCIYMYGYLLVPRCFKTTCLSHVRVYARRACLAAFVLAHARGVSLLTGADWIWSTSLVQWPSGDRLWTTTNTHLLHRNSHYAECTYSLTHNGVFSF